MSGAMSDQERRPPMSDLTVAEIERKVLDALSDDSHGHPNSTGFLLGYTGLHRRVTFEGFAHVLSNMQRRGVISGTRERFGTRWTVLA